MPSQGKNSIGVGFEDGSETSEESAQGGGAVDADTGVATHEGNDIFAELLVHG